MNSMNSMRPLGVGGRRGLVMAGGLPYWKKIKNLFGSAIICYPRLAEASGTVAYDASDNARNGTYRGVRLGDPGITDSFPAPYFDGVSCAVDMYSASLAAAFLGLEFSVLIWYKVLPSALTDGLQHNLTLLQADGSNRVLIRKATTNNVISGYYQAGGTYSIFTASGQTSVDWNLASLTVSKSVDQVKFYINKSQIGATLTGLGNWAGTLAVTTTAIGNTYGVIADTFAWAGWLSNYLILNRPATLAEITTVVGMSGR